MPFTGTPSWLALALAPPTHTQRAHRLQGRRACVAGSPSACNLELWSEVIQHGSKESILPAVVQTLVLILFFFVLLGGALLPLLFLSLSILLYNFLSIVTVYFCHLWFILDLSNSF